MPGRARELVADWLMVVGGVTLLVSLFLTWSHQFPRWLESTPGLNLALRGVPPNPTAWQVYSIADVLLALLAAALVGVALGGARGARVAVGVAAGVAVAFVAHAASVPPTNGLDVVNPSAPGRGYIRGAYASAGPGQTVALAGLGLGLLGAALGAAVTRRR